MGVDEDVEEQVMGCMGRWGGGGGEVEEQVNVGWEGKKPSTTCSLLSSFYLFTRPKFIYSLTSPPPNFMCKCAILCVHLHVQVAEKFVEQCVKSLADLCRRQGLPWQVTACGWTEEEEADRVTR